MWSVATIMAGPYTTVYLTRVPDLTSLYHVAVSQRATGRTTSVLRGLAASGDPFVYVVHNDTMVRVARDIIGNVRRELRQTPSVDPIRVVVMGAELRGTRHPIIFDHVCVEQFLHSTVYPRNAESERPTYTPRARPSEPWWTRLLGRARRCTKST